MSDHNKMCTMPNGTLVSYSEFITSFFPNALFIKQTSAQGWALVYSSFVISVTRRNCIWRITGAVNCTAFGEELSEIVEQYKAQIVQIRDALIEHYKEL